MSFLYLYRISYTGSRKGKKVNQKFKNLHLLLLGFPSERSSDLIPDCPPGRHELEPASHRSIIQKEEKQKQYARIGSNPIQLLDADLHDTCHETLDESSHLGRVT